MPRHRRILTLISIGAIVENLVLQGRHFGFSSRCSCFPDPAEPALIADIAWNGSAASRDRLVDAIPLRHTNRRFFHGPSLERRELDAFVADVNGCAGVLLTWLEGERRSRALHLALSAEGERFRNPLLHGELFSAIRFDVGWNRSCEAGLPPGSLEIERPLRSAFAGLRHWKMMERLNRLGAHGLLGLRAAYLPCRLSPHLGLITTDSDPEGGAIAAGRAFQRVWLTATLLGLALQPMAASVVLPLHETMGEASTDTKTLLVAGWKSIAPESTPLMLFRLGRAKPPTVTAGRLPADVQFTD